MDVLTPTRDEAAIRQCITKHGFSVEHQYTYFRHLNTPYKKNFFLRADDDMGVMALKTKSDVVYSLSEPLAPFGKRIDVYLAFLDHVFSDGAKKVYAELRSQTRKDLLSHPRFLERYRETGINLTLEWPVFDLSRWDGDKLEGKKWKKLRHILNQITKNHAVTFGPPSHFRKGDLRRIVREWNSHRSGSDRVDMQQYLNAINEGFTGFDHARVVAIDGKPAAITAGWVAPGGVYYSNLGLFNYCCDGLGELANWDDLVALKKKGFTKVDFGGSDWFLMRFKRKFKPTHAYHTHFFYVYQK